jgi:hypothetical protein
MDIVLWLRSLGLDEYERVFRENKVDAAVLPKLTADDLRDLGVAAVGDRRKLLGAIEGLRSGKRPEPSLPEATPFPAPTKDNAAERRQGHPSKLTCPKPRRRTDPRPNGSPGESWVASPHHNPNVGPATSSVASQPVFAPRARSTSLDAMTFNRRVSDTANAAFNC